MKRSHLYPVLVCFLLFQLFPLHSQTWDTVYQNRIKDYTTDARFYPESVGSIVDHPDIPSPLDHFGRIIGAPGVMHRTAEIYGYFQTLADASPELVMEQVGTAEEGRPIHLITIANAETINNLDRYKEIMAELADPRGMDKAAAEALIQEGKAVYYLNGGMHSMEMGSPEMLMERA